MEEVGRAISYLITTAKVTGTTLWPHLVSYQFWSGIAGWAFAAFALVVTPLWWRYGWWRIAKPYWDKCDATEEKKASESRYSYGSVDRWPEWMIALTVASVIVSALIVTFGIVAFFGSITQIFCPEGAAAQEILKSMPLTK